MEYPDEWRMGWRQFKGDPVFPFLKEYCIYKEANALYRKKLGLTSADKVPELIQHERLEKEGAAIAVRYA